MRVVGLITEYNPFHNGHAYHLSRAKELAKADYAVAVMSGDFVQRGAPAIFDKYTRTRMALSAGVDLVLELPAAFATGSAEYFSLGAVSLLDGLGVVDYLCFGSECGDVKKLNEVSSALAAEPPAYRSELKRLLKNGLSYPAARSAALDFSGIFQNLGDGEAAQLLSSPNNILGIEYLKALKRLNSRIVPVTVGRVGGGYHEERLAGSLSSASAVRAAIRKGVAPDLCIPESVRSLLDGAMALDTDDLTGLLNYAIVMKSSSGEDLSRYADMTEEMAFRLQKNALSYLSYDGWVKQLKTRQYTYTRISRALLHLILNIKKRDMEDFRRIGFAGYARVLGFRKDALPLLSLIKQKSRSPLITKTADAGNLLTGTAYRMFELDLACSHVYQSVLGAKYNCRPKNEYLQPISIL